MKMKYRLFGLATLLVAASTLPSAWAFRAPDREPLPEIDRRAAGQPAGLVAVGKAPAVADLQARLPGVQVQWNVRYGSPEHVAARGSFLTGPNAEGLAVAPEIAQAVPAGDPHRAVKTFLTAHAPLFGYGPEILGTATLKRDYTLAHNGLRSIHWQQELQGVSVFEGIMVGHVTRQGELVSLSTRMVPNLAQANALGLNHFVGGAANPPLTAVQAVVLAAADIGEKSLGEKYLTAEALPAGAELQQRFTATEFLRGPIDARLTWLDMDTSNLRLCWQVILSSASRGETVLTLLDAETGEVLLRQNLTRHISAASFNVWTNYSPAPMVPGLAVPGTNQAPITNRTLLTFGAISTNASPAGWVDDITNATTGNNCLGTFAFNGAYYLPLGNPNRVFDRPCDLTQAPPAYAPHSCVQAFYWMNFMHDTLYGLGFDEASGNFQMNNFGRGGVAGDPVWAIAQDPQMPDNAAMATPPLDGGQPTMYSGVSTVPFQNPERDYALCGDVMLHEFTHGLTGRVLGKGANVPYQGQSGGLQEGNSDFFALCVLSQQGEDLGGNYPMGAYIEWNDAMLPTSTPFNENYYYGLRRYPYSTNMLKDPFTYKDIDPAQADPHTGIPKNWVDWLQGIPADEVHNAGEIWTIVLWEMRVNLVAKHGFTNGNPMAMRLVIDGMRIAPIAPNYLQLRDAILMADHIDYNGTNYYDIWRAFAKRGMGGSATSPDGTTCIGVVEAFDMPGLDYVGAIVDDSVTGNNNGLIDLNECFGLKAALRNDSTNSITNITATISSLTPGVFVVDGTSPYPNLMPGATAYNLLPFRVYTTPDFACGTPVWFRLVHTSSMGQNEALFVLNSGAINPSPTRFNNGSTLFIPDGNTNGVDSFLPVAGIDARIGKVTVSLYLAHANVSDLTLQLIAPDGTAVTLVAGKGGAGLGFGTNCAQAARTTFDDSAPTSIQSALPPFVGSFVPQFPFAAFKGKSGTAVNGIWRLHIADQSPGIAGSLQCWTLSLYPVICTDGGGACAPDIQVTAVDRPDPAYLGQNLTYSVTVTNLRSVPAYGVFLTNRLPAGAAFVRVTNLAPAGLTNAFTNINGAYVFNLGTVSNQASFSFDMVVTPLATGLLTNFFSAFGTNGDMNLTNNTAMAVTYVTNALPLIAPAGALLVNDPNGSGGIEAGERVGLSFMLTNIGSAATTNLVATLRADSGVSAPSGPMTYGRLTNGGAAVAQTFTFTAAGTPGSTIRAIFDLVDQGPLGSVEFDFTVGASGTFQNLSQIIINDNDKAAPYPSRIAVSNVAGQINHATVTLNQFQHLYPQDVNVLLVGPGGQSSILMAHAGYNVAVSSLNLTFDSAASGSLPSDRGLVSGTFKPTLYGTPMMPNPAPAAPYVASLDVFKTTDPNGVWSLYVLDDSKFDDGRILGGWSLSFGTVAPINPTADLALGMAALASSVGPGAALTYQLTVTNFGPLAATAVVVTNPLPLGVAFQSASASQGTAALSGNKVVAALGTVPARGSATVTLNLTAPLAAGAFVNQATVRNTDPSQQDLYLGDNTATSTVTVTNATADLTVSAAYAPMLTGLTNMALLGSNLVFTTTVTNLGPDVAYGFWVTNTLAPSSAVSFVSVTNSFGGGGVAVSGATNLVVTCQVSNLAVGAIATVTVVVTPTDVVPFSNSVAVAGGASVTDPNPGNDQAALGLTAVRPAPQLVLAGVILTNNANNSIEPGEQVTAFFVLRNDGQVGASNVMATLLTNALVLPVGQQVQSYGTILPKSTVVSRPFTFSVGLGNAPFLTAALNLAGNFTNTTVSTNLPLSTVVSYSSLDYITIPLSGTALPYPSVLTVPTVSGVVSQARVTLSNLTHSSVHDVSALLVGPAGQNVLLMSHVGSGGSASSATLTFDDSARALPASLVRPLTNGTNRPTAYAPGFDLPTPAPAGPYGNSLADLNGFNPCGAWSLYVFDDNVGDSGVINGWSLSFIYAAPLPALADISASASITPPTVYPGGLQTITLSVANAGPSPATGVVLTDLLPAGVTLLSNNLPTQGTVTSGGGSLAWQVGALEVGANAGLKLYTRAQVSGLFFNTATVQANESDPAPANNTSVVAASVTAPIAGDLVAAGSVWKFLDTGATNLGNTWSGIGFDDSAWRAGPARLGYGHGDERTVVSYGSDPSNRVVTTYFRQPFYLASSAVYSNLTLRLLRVHGAVVYLNGAEVFRDNLPAGSLSPLTLALTPVPTNAQALYYGTPVSPGALVMGTNLLAVELHQSASNGYTIGFDLELLANTGFSNVAPTVAITSPTNHAVLAADGIFLNALAVDLDGLVTRVEYFATNVNTGAWLKVGETNLAPYEVVWANAPVGTYLLAARVWDNGGAFGFSSAIQVAVVAPISVLINRGDVWNYMDNGLDQGRTWTLLGFDDSNWPSGQTQIGFGDYPVTKLTAGPATNRFSAYYFRKTFQAPDLSYTNLFIELQSVHGAVVYLNGVELFRNNMPTGAVSYVTLALTNTPPLEVDKLTPFFVSVTNLVAGQNNQLAVEVHQWSLLSTNLAFDLRLSAYPSPMLYVARTNQTLVVYWPSLAANYALESVGTLKAGQNWSLVTAPVYSTTNGWNYIVTRVASTNQLYFRLRRQ